MKKIFSFLWKYLRFQKRELILVIIPMFAAFLIGPLVPLLYKSFIDLMTTGSPTDALVMSLWHTAWIFFAMIVISQISWKIMELMLIGLDSGIAERMYHEAFEHILGQSHRFFSGQPSGSIVRIVSRLADTSWQFIDTLIFQVFRVALTAIVMIVVMWIQNMYLGIAIAVWMILVVAIKGFLWRRNFAINATVSEASTRVSGQIADVFTNAFTVLTCGTRVREMRSFRHVVGNYVTLLRKQWWMEYQIFFTTTIFILILQITSISGIIILWSQGVIGAGTSTLILVYMTMFLDHAVEINFIFRHVYRQGSDMLEAINLLEVESEIRDVPHAPDILVKKGAIHFDHVDFSYHDSGESVLRDFCLSIQPGEKIALVGVSGSGKTTVLKLLFRLYETRNGTITIDEQDIEKVKQESLRRSMSMVPQDPVLFHRSIGENIAYASDKTASIDDILQAAKQAYAFEFIDKLPEKFDTLVGERGVKLSGGERQRVALARSILADKPILVLDEATSALDSISEKYIQESLHSIMKGRTTIAIAHRLSTIMQMDRIIVMDKGKIVEEGTHTELIKRQNGHYKKLWEIQTGEFIDDQKL